MIENFTDLFWGNSHNPLIILPDKFYDIIHSMAKARAHLLISGKVQGVCYRSFTQSTAHSCDVKGWVKNCGDGSVEAVFEGEKDAVEQAIALCYKGTSASRVTNIDTQWEDYKSEFDSFSIKY